MVSGCLLELVQMGKNGADYSGIGANPIQRVSCLNGCYTVISPRFFHGSGFQAAATFQAA